MIWSKTLIPTLKQPPPDAQPAGYARMLRAGLIRPAGAGAMHYLPLGLRILQKMGDLVRRELGAIGGAEVALAGDASAAAELAGALLRSYKQLPQTFFQLHMRTGEEPKPRGGLLRLRESLLAEVFSFCASAAQLEQSVEQLTQTCAGIIERCGLRTIQVDADPTGAGRALFVPCEAGEDRYITCDRGNYAATLDAARIGQRPWTFSAAPAGELERVHTPNLPSIDAVAGFLHVRPRDLLKTLVFRTNFAGRPNPTVNQPAWLIAVVRGDHDVSQTKLLAAARNAFGITSLALEDTPEVRRHWSIGFVGPDAAFRNPLAVVLVDLDAAQSGPWVVGANQADYHARNFNWFRECGDRLADPTKTTVADIRTAADGDPSPQNGGTLHIARGIELARVESLGDQLTAPMGAVFVDETGQQRPILTAAATIQLPRILAAVAETSHDDHGILWPAALAPFAVILTPIKYEGEVKRVADRLYRELMSAGIETILDDRDLRPGAKFADADLVGAPLRINIGERTLAEGKVEVKTRRGGKTGLVDVADVVAHVQGLAMPSAARHNRAHQE